MDTHKSRPWQGWREFLKEYVIIVIGVLTALGAEQAADWVHWRHEVKAAREHLREEINFDERVYAHRVGNLIPGGLNAVAQVLEEPLSNHQPSDRGGDE